jgi:hypothetical protein
MESIQTGKEKEKVEKRYNENIISDIYLESKKQMSKESKKIL